MTRNRAIYQSHDMPTRAGTSSKIALSALLAVASFSAGVSAQQTKEGLAVSFQDYPKFVEAFANVQASSGPDAHAQAAPRIVFEDKSPVYQKTSFVLEDSGAVSEGLDIINTDPANDPSTVSGWYSEYRGVSEETCKSDWQVLDEREDSLLFERITRGCPSLGSEHGLYKVLYGEQNNYVLIATRTPAMSQETRSHWLTLLGSARIELRGSPASVDIGIDWSAGESTPGFELAATEIHRKQGQEEGPDVVYGFSVSGPRKALKQKTFSFFLKELGREPAFFGRNLTVNRSGELMKSNNEPAEIGLGRFADGEPVMMAIISGDDSIKLVTRVVPFPIQADTGPCRITGELVVLTENGPGYAFVGQGFAPGDEVSTIARFGDWVAEGMVEVESNGVYGEMFFPDPGDLVDGVGSYTVVSGQCTVTLTFETPVL